MPIYRFGTWQINSICAQVRYGSNKAKKIEECFHVQYCSIHINLQTDPLEMIGLRANTPKIKAWLKISRGKKKKKVDWHCKERLRYERFLRKQILFPLHSQHVPCSDRAEEILKTRGRKRSDSFLFIWEWNPPPLAEDRAGSGDARCLCSPKCPAKLRAWVVNMRRAKGCSFTKQQRVAWTSVCCTVPSCWLTYCALAKGLPCLLHPRRRAGRLLSSSPHFCLHCSPWTQRAAEGSGRTSPTCPLPLFWFELLQGSIWPNRPLKMKQGVVVACNAAGHAGRWVWIKKQCSDQVSLRQTD